jgi:hypothetical protein
VLFQFDLLDLTFSFLFSGKKIDWFLFVVCLSRGSVVWNFPRNCGWKKLTTLLRLNSL